MPQPGRRNGSLAGFFSGVRGVFRALAILAFAAVLSFLTRNIITGVAIAAIAFYIWMQSGEIDALEARIKRLEESSQQRVTTPT